MSIASTLHCGGEQPITIVALGQGRLDPPVTLQPGQYLILLDGQAVAMDYDCQVGQLSRLVMPAGPTLHAGRHDGPRQMRALCHGQTDVLLARTDEAVTCVDCKAVLR